MKVLTKLIPTVKIWPNDGQISGLPKNPRFIRDERFDALVKSIIDDPEMMQLRELVVTPYADEYVVLMGNMRLKANVHIAGLPDDEFMAIVETKQENENFNHWLKAITELRESKSVLCKILPVDTPIEKLKAYIIKDNVGFGSDDWDLLANEWEQQDLQDWGMVLIDFNEPDEEEEPEPKVSAVKFSIEFDDLQVYDTVKLEVEELLRSYPGAKIKS